VNRTATPPACTWNRAYSDHLLGFRIDLDQGRRGCAITVASDYLPVPLASVVGGFTHAGPEAALDAVLPQLRRAARSALPASMRGEPVAGDDTLTLHAVVVRAPVVARDQTSAAEIAGHLSRWREVASFGWRGEIRDARRSAYELLCALELPGPVLPALPLAADPGEAMPLA
jgi:hypothetical protein